MAHQVPKQVQQERSRELAAVEAELREAYYRSLLGRKLRVLVESREPPRACPVDNRVTDADRWTGTACRYATVELAATAVDEGNFVDAVAVAARDTRIIAR
jgi:tRNA A37 methylthiotransferase MiaB